MNPPPVPSDPYALVTIRPSPEGASLAISPHSLDSQASLAVAGRQGDQDTGLSNPVGLLAEAAEESNSDGLEHNAVPRPAAHPALPPQYTLPDTLRSLLNEGILDERVASLHIDDDYLAHGLVSLLSDAAHRSLAEEDKRFFKPARHPVKRDLGPEYDPLDLALVTMNEVKVFFASYFSKLHPVLPVLDPALHTPECESGRGRQADESCQEKICFPSHSDLYTWSIAHGGRRGGD